MDQTLPLSKLKGINVYCENDLHDFARLMLTVWDAHAAHHGQNSVSRPTVNGLARKFASFANVLQPDNDYVDALIARHGLHRGAVIKFDDGIRR